MHKPNGGRAFLIVSACVIVLGSFAAMILYGGPHLNWFRDNVEGAKGAWPLFGIVSAVVPALVLWSVARPVRAAEPLAWAATTFVVCGAAIAFAWRPPISLVGTLESIAGQRSARVVVMAAVAAPSLWFASLLAGASAIAHGRRARRQTARAPESLRVLLAGLVGVALSIGALFLAWRVSKDIAWVIAPTGLTLIALLAAGTARSEDPDANRDTASAALLGFGAVLLGIASAGIAGMGSAEPRALQTVEIISELRHELFDALKSAALLAPIPVLVAALLVAHGRWRESFLGVGRSLLISAGALVVLLSGISRAFASVQALTSEWPWPPIAAELADGDRCSIVQPGGVVWFGPNHVQYQGEALLLTAPNIDTIASRIEAHDSSDDVWLAIDADSAPFGLLGGLLDSLGRMRGPRATGIQAGSSEPLEGCGARIVGRGEREIVCSEPFAFAGDCMSDPENELVWWVTMRSPQSITTEWRTPKKTVVRRAVIAIGELAKQSASEWREQGSHRDPNDRKVDRAVLVVDSNVMTRDAMHALAEIRSVQRDWYDTRRGGFGRYHYDYGPPRKRAVFTVSLALAAP